MKIHGHKATVAWPEADSAHRTAFTVAAMLSAGGARRLQQELLGLMAGRANWKVAQRVLRRTIISTTKD